MFSIFKKKVAGAAQAAKKIENRDFMEAAIGIMVAVAYADGDAEPAELEKLQQTIQTLPELQGFGPEIGKTVDKFVGYMGIGYKMGLNRIMRELRDVQADQQQKEDILALGAIAALADGEMEPAEKAVLEQVAREFGLKMESYV